MHTTTEPSVAMLISGKNFSECPLFSGHTDLPVLRLKEEFTRADYPLGAAGTGSMMSSDGAIGTLRIQFGRRQAYVLINLTDTEVIDALNAWNNAGIVPVSASFDRKDALIGVRTPPEFGQLVIAQGRRHPMSTKRYIESAIGVHFSGILPKHASSDIPAVKKLDVVTTSFLLTEEILRDAGYLNARA